MVDDHEDQLATSGARLERARLKYERLNKVIIAMKAGVGHLQDKLEAVRDELNGKRVDLNDDTVAEVLRESESVLSNVLRRLKAGEVEMRRARIAAGGVVSNSSSSSSSSLGGVGEREGSSMGNMAHEDAMLSTSRPYNQRVDLSIDDDGGDDYFAEEGGSGGMGGVLGGDADDDELTRDKVKRASAQILQVVERKRRKPKKRGVGGGTGGGRSDTSVHSDNNSSTKQLHSP